MSEKSLKEKRDKIAEMFDIHLNVGCPAGHLRCSLDAIMKIAQFMETQYQTVVNDLHDARINQIYDVDGFTWEREFDFWEQTVSSITYNALFCQMFAEYEIYMIKTLQMFNKMNNKTYKLNRQIKADYCKLIKQDLKIKDYKKNKVKEEIDKYYAVRNSITHLGALFGYLDVENKNGEINERNKNVKEMVETIKGFAVESFLYELSYTSDEDVDDFEYIHKQGSFYIRSLSLLSKVKDLMTKDAEYVRELMREYFIAKII